MILSSLRMEQVKMIDNARPKVSEQNGREEGKKCDYNRTKEICVSMNATIMFGITIGKSQ